MSELPEGWVETVLGELSEVNPRREVNLKDDDLVSFVPMAAVDEILGTITGAVDRPLSAVAKGFTQFRLNDVIFAKITPSMENGKAAVARQLTNGTGFGSTEFHVLRSNGAIEPDLLWRFVRQIEFRKNAQAVMSGAVGQQRVPADHLRSHAFSLPPLNEQRRIAAKLDQLLGQTARAKLELDRVRALLGRLRQGILDSIYFDVTSQYPVRPLIELTDGYRGIPYGIVQTGSPHSKGVPTVRAGDIKGFRIKKSELKLVQPQIEAKYTRTRLRGGEVLLSIRGTVGNAALVARELANCNISREVALIPPAPTVNPKFLMYFLGTTEAQGYLKRHTKGVAQTGINLEDVRSLPTPQPPLEIQTAVVGRVERALGLVEKLEREGIRAMLLLPRLEQAILGKAFRGELVPQDPIDEPALVLLERIRATRTDQPIPKRGRNSAATKSPREKATMTKSRQDEDVKNKPYLASIIKREGGTTNVEDLFRKSELPVTDFYKQLAWEVDKGHICDQANKTLQAA